MVLGKLPVPGRPAYLAYSRARAYYACSRCGLGGCLDIFSLVYHFSFLSPSPWETARYRLKYCIKGPLNPKQPTTNQQILGEHCSYSICTSVRIQPIGQGRVWESQQRNNGETFFKIFKSSREWSGGAMVLGKLPVPGRPTIWMMVGQGPTALAVGAGEGCLDNLILIYPFSFLSPSPWETARYRLKYCLKGPLNPKQPTNQSKAA